MSSEASKPNQTARSLESLGKTIFRAGAVVTLLGTEVEMALFANANANLEDKGATIQALVGLVPPVLGFIAVLAGDAVEKIGRELKTAEAPKPSNNESLKGYVEKVKSTGHLMRLAKIVMSNEPSFEKKAGSYAYLHMPLVVFIPNDEEKRLVRFEYKDGKEIFRLDHYLEDGEVESMQIVAEGLASEQGFDGISYIIGKDTGEEFVDEESEEESFVAEYPNPPLLGEEALPHAKRMLIELLF